MAKLRLKNMAVSQRIVYIVFFIFSMALTLTHFAVVLFGFMQGFKTHNEVVLSPFSLPTVWHFENYIDAFTLLEVKDTNFLGMIFNSLWYSVGEVVLQVAGTFCVVYVVTKYKFPGSQLLDVVAILVILIPTMSSSASYVLIYRLNLDNSPLFLITKLGTLVGPYLIIRGFLEGLSWTYAEAAFIDGASDFRTMWQIMLPQMISPLMAICVMKFMTAWNEFSIPKLYLNEMPVISVGLNLFKNDMIYRARMDILYAASMISVIPIWIIYAIFNKSLLNLTFGGGIKG